MATGTFCGTGAWATAPKPGDPEGGVTLTATPAFGGIDVEWTYPGVNPEAVAFGRLYRSTNLNDPDPILHQIVNGSFFYDKTTSATSIEYAYWIELVSINGTVGDRVGPAIATARPTIEQVIEGLTAQIDDGMLAQSLKGEIDKITLNKLEIDQALINQAAVDDSLAVSFNQVEAYSDETRALVQEEIVARTTANDAFVAQVNSLAVSLGDEITAAVQEETEARVSADEAIAGQLNTVESQLGNDLAQVQTNLKTSITSVNGEVDKIGALYTAKVDVNGLVGGFGVYNDGSVVEAGFDVDRFWVGRTGSNKRKPFIIENDETFIDEAVIKTLTFNKLRADNGSLIVSRGKVRADYIEADKLEILWGKIRDVAIDTADIKDAAITNAKIGRAAIDQANIKNAAVDTLQLAGQSVTIPVGSFTTRNRSAANSWVSLNSVSLYSSGAPIQIVASVHMRIYSYERANEFSNTKGYIRILRNGNQLFSGVVGQDSISASSYGIYYQDAYTVSNPNFLDVAGVGTATYTVQVKANYYGGLTAYSCFVGATEVKR